MLNPVLLYGMFGAAVPVIIHLLLKQKPRVEPFPTLRFILDSKKQTLRILKLKHLLLLLLRMAAIALFAWALARPTARIAWLPQSRSEQVSIVVVLDDSLSMSYLGAEGALFDTAVTRAGGILDELTPTSRVALILTSQGRGYLSLDHSRARSALGEASVTSGGHPVWPSIAEAYRLLRGAEGRRRIVVLTDMSDRAWQGFSSDSLVPLEDVDLVLVDLGPEQDENLAVEEARPLKRQLSHNTPLPVEARIRSPLAGARRTVELVVNDRRRDAVEVTAPSGSTQTVKLVDRSIGNEDEVRATVRFEGFDPLEADNRAYFSMAVERLPRVAVVGRRVSSRRDSDGFLYYVAAMPTPDNRLVRAEALTVENLSAMSLEGLQELDAVMLVGVGRLDAKVADRLATWVSAGGQVVLVPGSAPVEAWTWLPAQFGAVVRPEAPVTIDQTAEDHPFIRELTDDELMSLAGATFTAYRKIENPAEDATVVMRFSDGSPMLVHRATGRGHVLMLASPGQLSWSDLHTYDAFLAFVQTLARYGRLAASSLSHYSVGDVVTLEVPRGQFSQVDTYAVMGPSLPEPVVVSIDPRSRRGQ
ncbi:MAG: BatA domain-containing protein, partial [Planctomycetota bacterium]